MTHVSPRDALDPYRSCNSRAFGFSKTRGKISVHVFLSDIKTQSASPRRMPFLYIVNLASSFAETESQTLECTRRPRRRRRWRARRSTFGSSTRPRRTCAWRECTPVRRIDARKMSIVSRRHHRAHPRARSSSSTDRSFGRSTLRAPVARRLSLAFFARTGSSAPPSAGRPA